MERLSRDEAGQLRDDILERVPEHLKLGRAIIGIGIYDMPDDADVYGVGILIKKTAVEHEIRALIPLELQDNVAIRSTDTSPRHSNLSEQDREALRRQVSDLSDIPPRELARIDAGFAEAYRRAEDIRTGRRNPLC